jgi:hypothetical protein
MPIKSIHDDGNIYNKCVKCGKEVTLHVSDPQLQYVENSDMVQLPPCVCGSITSLRTEFTDEELQADNLITYGMVPEETTLPHAITGEPVPVLIPAYKPIGANPFAEQARELKKQLEKVNKKPKKDKDKEK